MISFTATYSPEDNKIHLYASSRLDAETYARVREVAEHSLNGLAEALRGADFSTLEAAHEQVRERDREAERSIEQERDISRERDDGFSL